MHINIDKMGHAKYAYCTLFNSKYLDKGLVLCKSLIEVCDSYTLYILAMDDLCYTILNELHIDNVVPIKLVDFENDDLLLAKRNRSFGQYCWTCSSSLIKYIFDFYKEEFCTYIDADMCFYSDPNVLVDEMRSYNKKVSIIKHRFARKYRYTERQVGHFCVEFNTFENCVEARDILDVWIKQCLDCCVTDDGVHWGDQKYLDEWPKKYSAVHVNENLGAGVAPWNLHQYEDIYIKGGIVYSNIKEYKAIPLVFYHFENIQYLDTKRVKFNAFDFWKIKKDIINTLYVPYLQRIRKEKEFLLSAYNLDTTIKVHPELNNTGFKGLITRLSKVMRSPSMFLNYILPARMFADRNYIEF